jgi:DNA invertase Pin-like site-specific DNA recombinase
MNNIANQTYGYLRVSTTKQELENNRMDILKYANDRKLGNVEFYEETVSGRKDWKKRKLFDLYEKLNEGDTLIMSEVSRISRSMFDSIEFLALCKRKKVNVYSLVEDIPKDCDAMSQLICALNSWKSESERNMISFRTKQALKFKKEQGVILGRKLGSCKLEGKNGIDTDKNKNDIKKLINDGVKYKFIAKKYNVTSLTLMKFINKYKLKL